MDDVLTIKNLCLNYQSLSGEIAALSDVNINVESGEFVSIVGPSGCGKSTLLSIIAGLIPPSSGTVDISGGVAYMLQKDHLFEWRNILQNSLLGVEINGEANDENKAFVIDLLTKYGLADFIYKKPSELSGGMRQRAALIRTLAVKPDVLLLDEPFSALDYQTRLNVADEIWGIIREQNKTALLVTHDIAEAITLADRVIVLSKRPGTVKAAFGIDIPEKIPMRRRESDKFRLYFNKILKELDINGQ